MGFGLLRVSVKLPRKSACGGRASAASSASVKRPRRRRPELIGEIQQVQRAHVSDHHERRMRALREGAQPQNAAAKNHMRSPDQKPGDERRRSG